MDVLCPRCGEPWDYPAVMHEEAAERARLGEPGATFAEVCAEFRQVGCGALVLSHGAELCEPLDDDATTAARGLYEALGDDMDGAAAMFDDFGLT
jgi:hypothetical protein